ncbi:MAG: hypothetical protein UX75_C0036G0012 [Candidatus Moranbacteria bacterium GW2011_GWE2_47_10]|nr:MAG: hypothetical protein UX75_C0036G0012 [Candidatus Moranbacteria bacterium GW2011_GWE2_47_10]
MQKTKTQIQGDQCLCWSPYHVRFCEAARKLGGRWDSIKKLWKFQSPQENQVIEICLDFFGECNEIKASDSIARRENAVKERDLLIKRLAELEKYLANQEIPDELRDND